jgi:hypothetical protein
VTSGSAGTPRVLCHHGVLTAAFGSTGKLLHCLHVQIKCLESSVADPGSGAFLPQGSGIRDDFFPDPGSRILTTSQIQDFTFKNGEKHEKLNFV